MKLAVIGAGSTYTPELVSGLSRERERSTSGARAARHRRRAARGRGRARAADARAAGLRRGARADRRSRPRARRRRLRAGPDPRRRPGGAPARRDHAARCGCIGQETTGAGGLAKALRTVPVVLEIAERVRERGGRGAWIVDFTNPVGIVTRALLDAGHRAVGLCNVAIGSSADARALLGVEPGRVARRPGGAQPPDLDAGRVPGRRDVLPRVARRARRHAGREVGLPPAIRASWARSRRTTCATSTPTTRSGRAAEGKPRAVKVAEIERELLAMYRDPALTREAGAAGAARRGVLQRGGDRARRLAREATARCTRWTCATAARSPGSRTTTWWRCRRGSEGGAEPLPQAPLAPELLGLVQHVAAYERLAAEAAVSGDLGLGPQGAARASAGRPVGAGGRAVRADARAEGVAAASGQR